MILRDWVISMQIVLGAALIKGSVEGAPASVRIIWVILDATTLRVSIVQYQ